MQTPQPSELTDQEICDALSVYEISPSADQIAQIRDYIFLLLKWNRRVSLTSITTPTEVASRHFGESMFASKLLLINSCRLVDIGTGAGFPGLPLKIFCPSISLILIESNKKKCAFLAEVVRTLGLQGVEIRASRFEEIRAETIRANVITSRAVGEFKTLLRWSAEALEPRGHIMLWLGADDATRISATPNWVWQPTVHIPDSQRRFILIGRPIEAGFSRP